MDQWIINRFLPGGSVIHYDHAQSCVCVHTRRCFLGCTDTPCWALSVACFAHCFDVFILYVLLFNCRSDVLTLRVYHPFLCKFNLYYKMASNDNNPCLVTVVGSLDEHQIKLSKWMMSRLLSIVLTRQTLSVMVACRNANLAVTQPSLNVRLLCVVTPIK